MTGRRIISIFLPSLPIERWQKANPDWPVDLPVALSIEGPHGPLIHDANRAAKLAGISRGALVTNIRTICPTLRVEDADPQGDAAMLARLVHWVRRWGPYSAADDADGMVIDTTGVAHLFGGEPAMLADMQGRFAVAGLTVRVALASNRAAAWALARFGAERAICHDLHDLHALPVAALRLTGETCLLLKRLGLKTIGDLAAIPRLSMMRRFNRAPATDNPLIRLDQAMGQIAQPIDSPEPAPLFESLARLAEPVMDPRDWLPQLTADLCARMARQDQGCRRLRLSVFRVDGERRDIIATCAAPSRDVDHLLRLWGDRLDRLDPGFGFDLITLTAFATEPLAQAQPQLDDGPDAALELARLIDRLAARFGMDRISRPITVESHVPERAETAGPPLSDRAAPAPRHDRPIRLFDPPEEIRVLYAIPDGPPAQFIWRRQNLKAARFAGPERIAPEWWRDRSGVRLRDYFRIEDDRGRRLWIYREGLADDGRGGFPRWFLHGVFA